MQNDEHSKTLSDTAAQEARRRWLRMGAAAPMVLTLVPGSSFAASAVQCAQQQSAADNARAEMAPKLAGSADHDEWVRAQVQIYDLFDSAGKPIDGKYVLSSDQQTYWRIDSDAPSSAGPSIASAKSTPRLSFGDGAEMEKDASFTDGGYPASSVTGVAGESRWALIKVDPDTGQPLGYSWEPQAANGMFITGLCFASMNVGEPRYSGGFGDSLTSYVRRVLGLT